MEYTQTRLESGRHKALKLIAVERGVDLTSVISEAVDFYLKELTQRKEKESYGGNANS